MTAPDQTIPPLTIANTLALPESASGAPDVVCGAEFLDRPVRWIHVAEQESTARLLDGGELLLATGIGWPDSPADRARFLAECAAHGAVGLAVEPWHRWETGLPDDIVASCRAHGLLLAVFHREVRFARITRAFHDRLIADHLAAVRATADVTDVFVRMIHRGVSTGHLVTAAAKLLGRPVILEDTTHRVIVAEEGVEKFAGLLDNWHARSMLLQRPAAVAEDAPYITTDSDGIRWTVASVQVRGKFWGRLLTPGCSSHPAGGDRVLGQAAVALAIDRLSTGEATGWDDLLRTQFIFALLNHRITDEADARAALTAAGFPVTGRSLLAAEIQTGGGPDNAPGIPDPAAVQTLLGTVPALSVLVTRSITAIGVSALVSAPANADPENTTRNLVGALTPLLDGGHRVRVVVGPPATTAETLLTALNRARRRVSDTPRWWWGTAPRPGEVEYTLVADDDLDSVLYALTGDVRLQAFVSAVLGPVLGHDARHGTDLMDVLRAVAAPQSRAKAAASCHLSRTSFYNRLGTVERLTGLDLADGESIFRVNLALHTWDGTRQ